MSPKTVTIVVFAIVYVFLAISKKYRATALWVGVFALAVFGIYASPDAVTIWEKFATSAEEIFFLINWNVMGIFAGVLLVAEFFILTKVPVLLSDILVDRSKNVGQAMLLVCVMTSFISMFVENVATVLIIAPLALQISRRLDISPVPFLVGIAISSNLQGTATLVGDPPSMILAADTGMNFNQFFFFRGKPGIFFAVQVGAVFSFVVLWLFYRKYKQPAFFLEKEKVTSWTPTILLAAMIIVLALMPFIDQAQGAHAAVEGARSEGSFFDSIFSPGVICMAFGLLALLWGILRDKEETRKVIRNYDYPTVGFLMGVFALVGALSLDQVGLIDDIQDTMLGFVGESKLLAFTVIVGFSVVFSAFIDNVPYLTAMLPVTIQMAGGIEHPLLAYGLLVGACLGGNITPIGAAANVVAVGILSKEGRPTGFWEFTKIGLPFTLAATIPAAVFLWLVWAP